jgi:hypothetical protein
MPPPRESRATHAITRVNGDVKKRNCDIGKDDAVVLSALDEVERRLGELARSERYRSDANAARSSSENSWGSSQAAKWPPLSALLKQMTFGYDCSTQLRGARKISPGKNPSRARSRAYFRECSRA